MKMTHNFKSLEIMIKQFYDNFANDYDQHEEEDLVGSYFMWKEQAILHERLRIRPADRILDAGCGTGRYFHLADRCAELIGIDVSTGMLVLAKRRNRVGVGHQRRVDLINCTITNLPFKRSVIDHVICMYGVLGHIPNENDRNKAIKEMARVLKPGGSFFLSTYTEGRTSILKRIFEILLSRCPEREGILTSKYGSVYCYCYPIDKLVKLLRDSGFRVLMVQPLCSLAKLISKIPLPIRTKSWLIRVTSPIDLLLSRVPPMKGFSTDLLVESERFSQSGTSSHLLIRE